MIKTSGEGTAFSISIALAFVGGYADAASFLLAQTFTGHLTGNCVLAAVSAASNEWNLAVHRLLAAGVFIAGILASLTLSQFIPHKWKRYSLAISLCAEVLLVVIASVFLANPAYKAGFIVCMCLALGIQNDALRKTNRISVHSTYMTGMVTTLLQKSFAHLFLMREATEPAAKEANDAAVYVLALMWLTFLGGAITGAMIVVFSHIAGLLLLVLPLSLLAYVEVRKRRVAGMQANGKVLRAG
ncbi:MAG: DUF1275 domain-containing protein [Verrucomicrobia bacterium]|nr:DUF1275 domain-containing protein [Verrucomicrobiota bacterium]